MKFAVVQVVTCFAEGVKVREDLLDPPDLEGLSGDVNPIRAEVDGDVEAVFEQPEILIAGAVERFNARADRNDRFNQGGGCPPSMQTWFLMREVGERSRLVLEGDLGSTNRGERYGWGNRDGGRCQSWAKDG